MKEILLSFVVLLAISQMFTSCKISSDVVDSGVRYEDTVNVKVFYACDVPGDPGASGIYSYDRKTGGSLKKFLDMSVSDITFMSDDACFAVLESPENNNKIYNISITGGKQEVPFPKAATGMYQKYIKPHLTKTPDGSVVFLTEQNSVQNSNEKDAKYFLNIYSVTGSNAGKLNSFPLDSFISLVSGEAGAQYGKPCNERIIIDKRDSVVYFVLELFNLKADKHETVSYRIVSYNILYNKFEPINAYNQNRYIELMGIDGRYAILYCALNNQLYEIDVYGKSMYESDLSITELFNPEQFPRLEGSCIVWRDNCIYEKQLFSDDMDKELISFDAIDKDFGSHSHVSNNSLMLSDKRFAAAFVLKNSSGKYDAFLFYTRTGKIECIGKDLPFGHFSVYVTA